MGSIVSRSVGGLRDVWRVSGRLWMVLLSVFLAVLCFPGGVNAGDLLPAANATGEESVPYNAVILMEPETGTILFEKNAHVPWQPASMVKMMTTLVVLEQIRDGQIGMDDEVSTSRWAARMGGSQVYLKEGEIFTVRELLRAVMIHSANDAAAALAEYVAGSPEAFVDLMNDKAEQLGLKETQYNSVHGLPAEPGQEEDRMSAYDLALLGRELLLFPKAAEWAATSQAPFRNDTFLLSNPNLLLRQYRGADGIKTGYHSQAGYCVTASAQRGDLRLIAVVLGTEQRSQCFLSTTRLLNRGFAHYRMFVAVKPGDALVHQAFVQGGVRERVPLVAVGEIRTLVKKSEIKKIQIEIDVSERVPAPITAGQVVGSVVATLNGSRLGQTQAAAAHDVAQASLWKRWWPF